MRGNETITSIPVPSAYITMSDPLREFNEFSMQPSSSAAWLPLESNPEVLNEFAERVGLASHFEFVDYYGPGVLDRDTKAFLLLFPFSESIYAFRQREDAQIRSQPSYLEFSEHLCFVKQVEDFGNACGTIGCLHVCLNTDGAMDESSSLNSFRKSSKKSSPQERGRLLHQTEAFKSVSDSAAVSSEAQTACPDRDGPDLDHHFAAFILDEVTSHIFEMDGTKYGPIDHGPSTPENFERDTWDVIQSNFLKIEPNSIEFSLMALVHKTNDEEEEED